VLRRCRSTAAGAEYQLQAPALSSRCGQRYAESRGARLSTDSLRDCMSYSLLLRATAVMRAIATVTVSMAVASSDFIAGSGRWCGGGV